MKKLTLLTVLVLILLPTPVFAGWTKIGTTEYGNTFYVDFERIRKHGGYVYWWELNDFLKPDEGGYLSAKVYNQGDCRLFRHMHLSGSFHKEPMGEGTGDVSEPPERHKGWKYPPPNSAIEGILKSVCQYAK